ncbi:MAG TPA: hypothetical protein VI756_30625, partial [Blastocatellia bacterium]
GPKDIREVFLTFPAPPNLDDLFADFIGDSTQRKLLLQRTDFSRSKSVLDIPNGYLKVEIAHAGAGSSADRRGSIILTSFTKRNQDRLVVLQLTNLTDYPDPVSTDYFYRLSDGIYKAASSSDFLPALSFLADFWGEQPAPDAVARDFIKLRGDTAFYSIDWPRNGTVAKARAVIPYSDTDSPEMDRIRRTLSHRWYQSIDLVWDKDKGRLIKGGKSRTE